MLGFWAEGIAVPKYRGHQLDGAAVTVGERVTLASGTGRCPNLTT